MSTATQTASGSRSEQGASYLPDYLAASQADRLLEWALSSVCWRSEEIRLFGRVREVPRLVAWFGEPGRCYRYSGRDHTARGWPVELKPLVGALGELLGAPPDFVLLNRYRSGRDTIGWHRDDERMSGGRIASISLGAKRRFLIRADGEAQSRSYDLSHGSLLLLDRTLRHCLPRTRRQVGERVNLTFRVLR